MGVVRSLTGNLPHIHQRTVSHKRALAGILSMGLSRRHRANPIAALRAETVFATPVLYSGMASIFVSKSEALILAKHVKETTENLLKLHPKTPEPVVFFLAGRLPGEATLHLKQLTLFGMICRLPGNILNTIAYRLLTFSSQSSKNWFSDIRTLCFKYNLPHPLKLLREPPSKESFKNLIKTNITDFWQENLRAHSATMEQKSLKYFKPKFMSLLKPHPMWQYATTSYKVNKTVTVSRMLSGRFRCGSLVRHFYPHITGLCMLCITDNTEEIEDLPHILVPRCPLLFSRASILLKFARESLLKSRAAGDIFDRIMNSKDDTEIVQFLLDPSVVPEVIAAQQNEPGILELLLDVTTTWCYSLNRTRVKLLGK